jgi:hypothetical protein
MVRSKGNMSLKDPVTQPGIDPGTVRLVAQRLNHYVTPGPNLYEWHREVTDRYRGHYNNTLCMFNIIFVKKYRETMVFVLCYLFV